MQHRTVAKERIFYIALVALFTLTAGSGNLQGQDARAIMEKNYYVMKVPTIKNTIYMTLVSATGNIRERKMNVVGKLRSNGIDSMLLIRFLYPADIKGTGFLQIEETEGDDNMWVYLPGLGKTRRIVANNKKDSFFGSDFSYGDILPRKVDLFRHRLLQVETSDGNDCYVIESIPRDEHEIMNSGYGKKISWIRKDNFVENKIEYYDGAGQLLKTQQVSDHTIVDSINHKWMARRREMITHRTNHRTILKLDHIRVGDSIPDAFFTTRTLERE